MSNVNNVSKKCSSNNSEAFKASAVDTAYVDDEDSSSVEILPEPESERYVHSSSNYDSPLTGVSTSAAAVTIPAVITTTPDNVVSEINNPVEVHASEGNKMPVLSHGRVINEEEDDDKEKAIGVSPDGRYVLIDALVP